MGSRLTAAVEGLVTVRASLPEGVDTVRVRRRGRSILMLRRTMTLAEAKVAVARELGPHAAAMTVSYGEIMVEHGNLPQGVNSVWIRRPGRRRKVLLLRETLNLDEAGAEVASALSNPPRMHFIGTTAAS